MVYITREDGVRFVIPSYRDTLSASNASTLKKELIALSANYGEYVALQKKSSQQYEVAFSPDAGYLLGETVWNHFKRPPDMIYCEAIPDSSEAILVIVTAGSVYLDGSFQIESIPEELVVFKTQENNFAIYIHGHVPIAEHPQEDMFSFDATSVKSFETLDEPVFPLLARVNAFELKPVETVLKEHGIGVLPIKMILVGLCILVGLYLGYNFFATIKKELPVISFVTAVSDPYQAYSDQLVSPDPSQQLRNIAATIYKLYTIPGWTPLAVDYIPGFPSQIRVNVVSVGARLGVLTDWAARNNTNVEIAPNGVYLNLTIASFKRNPPKTIYSLQNLLASMLDRISYVVPGNNLQMSAIAEKRQYKETNLTLNFSQVTPTTLNVIGIYIEGLPLILTKFNATIQDGNISGSLIFKALGN